MKNCRIFARELLLISVLFGGQAMAQSTIFTIPTTDTVAKGKVYGEFDFMPQVPATVEPPSLRQAVRWIAQLGGFLARRNDGEPGPIVVWRGLHELHAITAAWRRFRHAVTCG